MTSMECRLANQPPEIMRIITSYLTYPEVIQLVRTNNRNLTAILTRLGGVRDLHFILGVHGPDQEWPTFHESIKTLQSLTIESGLPLGEESEAQLGLFPKERTLNLPTSLTSLTFLFPHAERWLRANCGVIAVSLPNLLHLDLEGNSTLQDADLAGLPSKLTFLSLRANIHLTEECGSSMPESLVYLALPSNDRVTPRVLKDLKHLQVVKMKGQSFEMSELAFLPTTIEELELTHNDSIMDDQFSMLPRSLTKLNLMRNTHLKGSSLSCLPDLVSLTLGAQLVDSDIGRLGKSMTQLSISDCGELTDDALILLPRTLTSFSGWNFSGLSDDGIALLPRCLCSIFLSAPQLTDESAAYLPPTLTSLRIHLAPFSDDFIFNLDTPHLVDLELSAAPYITNESIPRIPRSVRTLQIPSSPDITAACIPDLPPCIRVCAFWAASGFEDVKDKLPPTVVMFFASDFILTPFPTAK